MEQDLVELIIVEAGDVYMVFWYTFLPLLYTFEIFHNQMLKISFVNM